MRYKLCAAGLSVWRFDTRERSAGLSRSARTDATRSAIISSMLKMSLSVQQIQVMHREFFAHIRRWLGPHLRQGLVTPLPEELYIALIAGPAQEFARRSLAGRARTDITEAAKVLAEATWHARRPTGAVRRRKVPRAGREREEA